jgi:hypothetical protein
MMDSSTHNSSFSMKEMQEALKTLLPSSPGPDDVNYEIIAQPGIKKRSWQGSFLEEWRTDLTIPIQKSGKDPGSYQPISLSSYLGKVMKRWSQETCTYSREKETDASPTVRFETRKIDYRCSQHSPV